MNNEHIVQFLFSMLGLVWLSLFATWSSLQPV